MALRFFAPSWRGGNGFVTRDVVDTLFYLYYNQ